MRHYAETTGSMGMGTLVTTTQCSSLEASDNDAVSNDEELLLSTPTLPTYS
jgi:hypothetical protein